MTATGNLTRMSLASRESTGVAHGKPYIVVTRTNGTYTVMSSRQYSEVRTDPGSAPGLASEYYSQHNTFTSSK